MPTMATGSRSPVCWAVILCTGGETEPEGWGKRKKRSKMRYKRLEIYEER